MGWLKEIRRPTENYGPLVLHMLSRRVTFWYYLYLHGFLCPKGQQTFKWVIHPDLFLTHQTYMTDFVLSFVSKFIIEGCMISFWLEVSFNGNQFGLLTTFYLFSHVRAKRNGLIDSGISGQQL